MPCLLSQFLFFWLTVPARLTAGRRSMYSKTAAHVMLVQVNNIISLTAHMPPVHVVCIDWPYIQGPRYKASRTCTPVSRSSQHCVPRSSVAVSCNVMQCNVFVRPATSGSHEAVWLSCDLRVGKGANAENLVCHEVCAHQCGCENGGSKEAVPTHALLRQYVSDVGRLGFLKRLSVSRGCSVLAVSCRTVDCSTRLAVV